MFMRMSYKSWSILVLGCMYFIDLCNCQKPCTMINLKSDIIKKGLVNVIYLMSYNCEFCYTEAQQLPVLKMEMEEKGININIIVAVDSNAERVSAHVPGITVDSAEIWSTLGQHNGHVFVFDKCNRLAYEVIMPWSHHRNPFVKAAILSTFHSLPCGLCPLGETFLKKEFYNYKKNTGILQYPPINGGKSLEYVIVSQSSNENSNSIPPMRIIFSQQHKHKDDPNMYNYIELLADDPSYHKHPEDETEYFFGNSPSTTTNEELENNNLNDDHKSANSRNQLIPNDYNNGVGELPIENKTHNASDDIMTKEKLWSHYCNILLWLPHV